MAKGRAQAKRALRKGDHVVICHYFPAKITRIGKHEVYVGVIIEENGKRRMADCVCWEDELRRATKKEIANS